MAHQENDKAVERLIAGMIDMHIHIDPESRLKRSQAMLQGGITEKEIETMIKKNPARLLKID